MPGRRRSRRTTSRRLRFRQNGRDIVSVINWDAINGINEWALNELRVIIHVYPVRGNDDKTTQQCDYSGTLWQRQERVGGTMVVLPDWFQVKPDTTVYAYD